MTTRDCLAWFDIRDTFECGQVFRYHKLRDDKYSIVSSDKYAVLEQYDDRVDIETNDIDYFRQYFDVDTDYGDIIARLNDYDELREAIKFGSGIRILRQNLLETIISFIISANNNIGRIRKSLFALSRAKGNIIDIDNEVYAFPLPAVLAQVSVEEWIEYGVGYRAAHLVDTTHALVFGGILDRLSQMTDYDSIYRLLMSLKGVGPKVADCIMLFAVGRTDSFPVDTWIFNSLKSPTLDTKDKVHKYYCDRYGKLCGYAQQYIFYYNRSSAKA